MPYLQFHIFSTDFGYFGFAWDGQRITCATLPLPSRPLAEARLKRICTDLPCSSPAKDACAPEIRQLVGRVQRYFEGKPTNLIDVPLDLDWAPPFYHNVYKKLRTIAAGQTLSYGELARLCQRPRAARAVGQAMAANRIPLFIPCHRVVAQDGLGNFSAFGGTRLKRRLLALEGCSFHQTHPQRLRRHDKQEPATYAAHQLHS